MPRTAWYWLHLEGILVERAGPGPAPPAGAPGDVEQPLRYGFDVQERLGSGPWDVVRHAHPHLVLLLLVD